jgi:RNA polymerase sigma-70 factor (ECF subfamily)
MQAICFGGEDGGSPHRRLCFAHSLSTHYLATFARTPRRPESVFHDQTGANVGTELPYMTGSDRCASASDAEDPGRGDLGTLLEAVARGEHGAFDLVYEQLAALVRGVIGAVLRDRAQTEEVAQEVLLEIWQLASRYDPGKGTAAAWARTIARRRAIDRVRSAAATTARERRIAAAPCLDQVSHAVENVENTVDYERLHRCLERLSDRRREAILLAFYDGYSYS